MKSLNLAVTLATMVLTVSGLAQADDFKQNLNNQNFISKRPYQKVLPDSAYNKNDDKWEGATLIDDEGSLSNGPTKHQKMRIDMLGRRPYME